MEETGEFQDWEMLQNSETSSVHSSTELEGESVSLIRSDHFALDRFAYEEENSVDSDNPSWVDPSSDSRYGNCSRNEVGFEGIGVSDNPSWVDPSSDSRSDSRSEEEILQQVVNFEEKNDLGCGDDSRLEVGFEGIGVTRKESCEFWLDSSGGGSISEKFSEFGANSDLGCEDDSKKHVGLEGIGQIQGIEDKEKDDSGKSMLDSGSDVSVMEKFEGIQGESQLEFDNFGETGEMIQSSSEGQVAERLELSGGNEIERGAGDELKSGDEGKRGMVWWKLPFELFKFCVFRVNPVWTFSIAAAVMGLVILKRRLSKMKRKSRTIPIKLTVEDKKVSQFMLRATRLNEAFSVVRRVPIIRPLLPSAGVTPWPVLNLR